MLQYSKAIRQDIVPFLFNRFPLLRLMFRGHYAKKPRIAVLGGHGGDAFDDNSRAMAVFLRRDPGYKVYWIGTQKASLHAAEKAGITALQRGTMFADAMVAAADEIYYSHGFTDLTQVPYSRHAWRKVIYLGHGVWGFKRIERRKGSEQPKLFDLTVCVSEHERALKAQVLNVPIERVAVTGVPKHDALMADTTPPRRTKIVLYAPTWRDWLQHKPSDVAINKHFRALERVAASMPKRTEAGEKLKLVYAVHKNIRGLSDRAEEICSRYNIDCVQTNKVDVNVLLRKADYLISDYSAMFWDFIVQGKPAARFVFDRQIYNALTGSYTEIEHKADIVTFTDPKAAWSHLLSPNASEISSELAALVMPYSDGRACEKLASAVQSL